MTTLTTWSLVAETKEWVGPLTVDVNGTPVTNFEVSVVAGTARPTTWEAPDPDPDPPGTARGVLVGTGSSWPLVLNQVYTIFVRFTDSPEAPVLRAGKIKVT